MRPRRAFSPLFAIQSLPVFALTLGAIFDVPSAHARERLLSITYLVIGAPSLIALWAASRTPELDAETRRAWRLMALAVGTYWMGDAIWAVIQLVTGDRPPLSIADLCYVAFAPLAIWSVTSFPGLGATRAERWRVQFDASIAAITAGTVLYWLSPWSLEAAGLTHFVSDTLNAMYPLVGAMLVCALMVFLVFQRQQAHFSAFRWLLVAFAIKTVADQLYAQTIVHDLPAISLMTDACWLSWYLFITIAASKATVPLAPGSASTRVPRVPEWLVYACVGGIGVLLVVLVEAQRLAPARGVAVGMLLLLFAVLARQANVVRENARLDALAAERSAEARLAALVQHASDMVLIVDVDGFARYVSPSVLHVMGATMESVQHRNLYEIVHHGDLDAVRLMMGRLARHADASETIVARVPNATGEWRWLEIVGTNRLQTPSIQGVVLNARDVTERRELEGRLAWQAFHDPMTSLANRVLFADRVTHALARRERGPVDIGVLFLDLDHFKIVNDTLGHAAGDELLRQVARRIELEVRAADTVARLGGDEFAVLLEDSSAESCDATAERLLQQLTRAFTIEGREVFVGASVGVTEAQPGVTLDELVRDADVAMYVAKAEGRGRVVRFEASMRAKVADRLQLEADLRRAIERDELQVHYQPLVDLQTGDILGAEALLRWHHPTRGLISPATFVPIAEDAGLIRDISRRVLRTACRDAMTWQSPDPEASPLHVAVNLSGRHLQEATVVDDVREALEETGLSASQLTIEMTESVMMKNADGVVGVMRQLKSLGVTLALDDFGTGYSSLSYLQRFPIDVLKIDKSFINQLGGAAGDDALTRAILSLGETLGLATVAEGIEGEKQLTQLQAMGCMLGQGFLMSQPIAGPAFARLVASGEPLHRLPNMPTPSRGVPLLAY